MRAGQPDVISDLWYENAILYNCDVRTYLDSNGDGVGDFEGLQRRLDYLHGPGIIALWLMPFFPSPDRDDGYDITDYYNIDPRYGTLGEFVEFSHAAKQRGIRVIADLVVNHTSDQHPWFKEARSSKKSRYRDWYVWSPKRPPDWNQGMVFPGVQKSTWTRDSQSGEWYFHRFYDFQPDLNTKNPEVQAEIRKIMGFWLQLGVSGFRMDAVPFVIGNKGPGVRPRENYDMLRDLRAFLSWRSEDAILLAEANVPPATDLEYFGDQGERMQMMFNFQINQHLFYAALHAARDAGGALRRRAWHGRRAAPRPRVDVQLDRADHPHAQGVSRDRLGRLHRAAAAAKQSAGGALRLARQRGGVSAQPRGRAGDGYAGEAARREAGDLLSEAHSEKKGGVHQIPLEPYGYRCFRAGGLDCLLKRRAF